MLLGGGLCYSLAPKVYRATAHVALGHNIWASPVAQSNRFLPDVDAYLVEDEVHLIVSPRVLYEVVGRLQLRDPENDEPLSSDLENMVKICSHLKRLIRVVRVPNTCLLAIEVTWRDRIEAAKIANDIAATYANIVNRLGPRTINLEIEAAKSNLKGHDQIIASQQKRVLQLQVNDKTSRSERFSYFYEKAYLKALKRGREAISNHVDDLQSEYMRASGRAFEAETDLAVPPRSPIWPKSSPALLCMFSGLILSLGGALKMRQPWIIRPKTVASN